MTYCVYCSKKVRNNTVEYKQQKINKSCYKTYVYNPYREVIDAGNIEFFFDKDYKSDLETLSNSGEIIKMIDAMRNPIKSMSDNNKAHSMKYIQNLSKLSARYE